MKSRLYIECNLVLTWRKPSNMDEFEEFKNMLRMCLEKIDNLETGQAQLRDELYTKVLNPIAEGEEEQKFKDFRDKYSYELGDYEEPLKKLEGDDFDIYREAYNQSAQVPDEQMDDWVMGYADKIADEIDKFREAFGLAPDDKVEIESKGEGDVQVEVNDKPIDETSAEPVADKEEAVPDKDHSQSYGPEEIKESEEVKTETEPTLDEKLDEGTDETEEEDDTESLLEEFRKYKK